MDEVSDVVVGSDEIHADVGDEVGVESLAAVYLILTSRGVAMENFGDGQARDAENVEYFLRWRRIPKG